MNDTKTILFNIRISPQEKKELEKLAASENRSMSNYLRNLIRKDIETKTGR